MGKSKASPNSEKSPEIQINICEHMKPNGDTAHLKKHRHQAKKTQKKHVRKHLQTKEKKICLRYYCLPETFSKSRLI